MSANTAAPNTILTIEYPDEGRLRARKVISRSKARPTGKYPSWKMGRMIHWESSHELNAYRLLDANPAVKAFYEQPMCIRFRLEGVEQRHYPDTLVVLHGDERELWEIKTAVNAAEHEYVARARFLQTVLPDKGFTYRMVLGEDLGREPRLANVLTMLRYGRPQVDFLERERMRQMVAMATSFSWGSALEGHFGPKGRNLVARLFLEGVLTFDIECPLSADTLFTAAGSTRKVA